MTYDPTPATPSDPLPDHAYRPQPARDSAAPEGGAPSVSPYGQGAGVPAPTPASPYVPPVFPPRMSAAPAAAPAAADGSTVSVSGAATDLAASNPADGAPEPVQPVVEPLPALGAPGTAFQAAADGAKQAGKEKKQSGGWVKVTSAAAITAVLASLGTAWLTGAFDPDSTPAAATSASQSADDTTSGQATTVQPVQGSTTQNPDWQAVAAAVRDTVVAIQVTGTSGEAEGSGVIIDAEKGYIVTNNHVVAEGSQIQVALTDGTVHSATVVGTDPTTDIAVIKLDQVPSGLKAAAFADSSAVQVGQEVMAVGNPLGLDNTVTKGIISAINRPVTASSDSSSSDSVVTNAIQIDAAINPGNSGGPLFNAQGQIIGINSSIATLSAGASTSGSIGIGFAIPSNQVKNVAQQLIDSGKAEHAYLGVSLGDGTAKVGSETRAGAEVKSVTEGTPAADAGLKVGDVIVGVNGNVVTSSESLVAYVRSFSVGDQVTLQVARDGAVSDVKVSLTAKPDAAATTPDQTTPQDQGGQGAVPQLPGQGGQQLPQDLQQLLEQYLGQQQGSGN